MSCLLLPKNAAVSNNTLVHYLLLLILSSQSANSQGIWSKTIGGDTKYLVDLAIMIQCFASTVVYSGILGDGESSSGIALYSC